jgi:hypothetical protein
MPAATILAGNVPWRTDCASGVNYAVQLGGCDAAHG